MPGIIEAVILALETSCDETAAALVTDAGEIKANVVASQADLHARYGGVVPEIASRRHLELVLPVLRETQEQAGATLDDVDRVAVTTGPGLIGALLVGLGYPGGAELDRLARTGDPDAYSFPVARVPGFDFSFSGLKTALLYAVRELPADELERRLADLAASYQRAIVRALVERTHAAAEQLGSERVAVVGGVAANSELRAALPGAALAPLPLCTDNAAMIASAARYAEPVAHPGYLEIDAFASIS